MLVCEQLGSVSHQIIAFLILKRNEILTKTFFLFQSTNHTKTKKGRKNKGQSLSIYQSTNLHLTSTPTLIPLFNKLQTFSWQTEYATTTPREIHVTGSRLPLLGPRRHDARRTQRWLVCPSWRSPPRRATGSTADSRQAQARGDP
jgi:hypothetical protein